MQFLSDEYLPYIVQAVGTAATVHGQNKAAKERRAILNAQMERERQATDKSVDLVMNEANRYAMPARTEALTANEGKTYDQIQADLQGAGGAAISTSTNSPNVSKDFLTTKALRTIEEGQRMTAMAREAAKARAPGMLGLDDRISMADTGGQVRHTLGAARNLNDASGLAAQAVQDPAYAGLGKIATAIGSGMAAGGYGKPRPGVPPNPYASGINFGRG